MAFARHARLPSYRRHKPTGQAVVTLNGRDIYLGAWSKSPKAPSRREYDRLIGEWLAAGRTLPTLTTDLSVAELAVAYVRHAKGYYRKNGVPTKSLIRTRLAMRRLGEVYGSTFVREFGPLRLQALQAMFVREGKARPYVNYLIEEIKRAFSWGVAREMVPAGIHQALTAVPGLRRGRTDAPEPAPIRPVDDSLVEAVLPHMPAVIADMVRLQRLLGCRPGEICAMRPCDVDRTGEVWRYEPASHKTEHHGRKRIIFIGPRAQVILAPYLLRDAEAHCFTPADSERRRLAQLHEKRKTPLSCGNKPGSNKKRHPKRCPGDRYEPGNYTTAVRRACDLADAKAHRDNPSIKAAERIVPRWTPNQLRHNVATEVRRRFGLEGSQVVLGHANARITEVYAERDEALASRIMGEVG